MGQGAQNYFLVWAVKCLGLAVGNFYSRPFLWVTCTFFNAFLGFIQSTCFSRIFWMKLDKAFVEGKFFTMVIVGKQQILVKDQRGIP